MRMLSLAVAVAASLAALICSSSSSAAAPRAGSQAREFAFDSSEPLAGWTTTGDVTVDTAKGRRSGGRSLKVGPGGKALLKLRDRDESGRVEVWIYDDGAIPEDPKANRAGPRWGLVQSDGKVLAVGVLYAGYLGGAEGYTATACDGQDWFDQLFWLGVNRAPAGWHRWTFDFDPEAGLQVLHNDRQVSAVDSRKTGLEGFGAFAVWGDEDKGRKQTIWLADMSVTLGGPMNVPPMIEPTHTMRKPWPLSRPEIALSQSIQKRTPRRRPSSRTCR